MTRGRPVRVTRRAAAEIVEAAAWWATNRPSAPSAVSEELLRAFALIATQPRVGARAHNAALREVRRVHLSRIRYHLYYRVRTGRIEVLALWHTGRGTDPAV